ncbi:glycosyltransferase [Coraliomargarita parva]|uniref:glycosyltransferase n=1 Tax=Coraliomargarita parva TaxID=3014050 RepID=UPI0022B2BFAB|nr:glycosyltransferase [Coraliomargarita parva]
MTTTLTAKPAAGLAQPNASDATRETSIRVVAAGKYLRRGKQKFYVKGFSYGPFAPNQAGESLPEPEQVARDFAQIRELGANTVRVYFPPPVWFLDEALKQDLMVFIDVPWEKHRCFLDDWYAMERARDTIRKTARELGGHPAVLAISVVNEFPVDAVRYQGRRRVEKFVEELLTIAKNEAPECLVTFVNYPTTEFLEVQGCDFTCFNVYVHDEIKFGRYLDRLQHLAGDKPLVLGEYGIDSSREGKEEQAEILIRHLKRVYRHGLSGSVVFAYTDDWFTGGHQITDWFFGVTHSDRSEKPAAKALREIWKAVPDCIYDPHELPRVSVVVCSYNGSRTLEGCLESLMKLEYPDYEVIVVNDGSTDSTGEIAQRFPRVRYFEQVNKGLSVARNKGAELATGEIVAYTDDDCVIDEHWLHYLVLGMKDQAVEAIGGPNITPDSDGWPARCAAASPGNPSHVMLDDHYAEHIPGCNMAFRRDILLGLGGFDAQYRVAGDDVDMCWRLLDAGYKIGYASGAMVWHHRRASVKAYAKQQKGYGRSESMVQFKHPQRFGYGYSRWKGVIYGDGAVGLPLTAQRIYHGHFGSGLFQVIYRHNNYSSSWMLMSLEWHLIAIFVLGLAVLYWPLAFASLGMWACTIGLAVRSAVNAPLPRNAPRWCRPLVAYLYFMQPIWRGWTRLTHRLRNKTHPEIEALNHEAETKPISSKILDLYWDSSSEKGREVLLPEIVRKAEESNWAGDFDDAWAEWDLKLVGDDWHAITIRVATEELGWPRRFTRARCSAQTTLFQRALNFAIIVWCLMAVVTGQLWALALGVLAAIYAVVRITQSRKRCLTAASRLVAWASMDCGLSKPVSEPTAQTTSETASSTGTPVQPKTESSSIA